MSALDPGIRRIAQDVPNFLRKLCPVTTTSIAEGKTNSATFYAMPDYLPVGSDDDYFLAPMSPNTGQRIADALHCSLPTPKMVDAIYAAAEVKLAPMPIPPSPAMTTVPVVDSHLPTAPVRRSPAGPEFLSIVAVGERGPPRCSSRSPRQRPAAGPRWQWTPLTAPGPPSSRCSSGRRPGCPGFATTASSRCSITATGRRRAFRACSAGRSSRRTGRVGRSGRRR